MSAVRRQSALAERQTPIPNCVEDVVTEENSTQSGADDDAAARRLRGAFAEQNDDRTGSSSFRVGDGRRPGGHGTGKMNGRKREANGDTTATKRAGSGRRASGAFYVPQSVLEPVFDSFPVAEERQTSGGSSKTPDVSPNSTASSDRLSHDTLLPAIAPDRVEEPLRPTDLRITAGRSPADCLEPMSADAAADQMVNRNPDSSPRCPAALDERDSERLDSGNGEDRKKTASGISSEGVVVQTASSDCICAVDKTSASVAVDRITSREDGDRLNRSEQVESDRPVASGTSVVSSGPTGDRCDGERCSSAVEGGDRAGHPLDVTRRKTASAERRRRPSSAVVTRRRRADAGKQADVFRLRKPAADRAGLNKPRGAGLVVFPQALHNGIKTSPDD